jgi:L-asparaginase
MAAAEPRPRIVVFSGPRATIQNSAALVTGRTRREGAEATGYNAVRSQRLAAPVTVYIEAFSAHPLEKDAADLYGEVDGYVDAEGSFSPTPTAAHTTPVYRATLRPEDGPFLLPYLATQPDGVAWDSTFASTPQARGRARQTFYPDASGIVADIDRYGIDSSGHNNLLGALADFEFVRAAPSGGYTRGQPAAERTDVGEGDIAPETLGEDFFAYTPLRREPALRHLAQLTNVVNETMATGRYTGGIWLEGSPTGEETIYWLNLVIPTEVPLVANASQYPHGVLGNDGDHNLLQSTQYITSRVWADADGKDRVGGVMVQNGQIFTAREVQKADARPGGYVAAGGHGGIVGNTVWDPVLTFLPVKKHTHTSELRLDRMPEEVRGNLSRDGAIVPVTVRVKDAGGRLTVDAMPKVTIARYVNYGADDVIDGPDGEVEILARIDRNLSRFALAGFVAEGSSPYGGVHESMRLALERAVLRGMPVVAVGRGGGGFVTPFGGNAPLFINGSNFTAPKARMLLMACLLKFGALPVPEDPDAPTEFELDQIRKALAEYAAMFATH